MSYIDRMILRYYANLFDNHYDPQKIREHKHRVSHYNFILKYRTKSSSTRYDLVAGVTAVRMTPVLCVHYSDTSTVHSRTDDTSTVCTLQRHISEHTDNKHRDWEHCCVITLASCYSMGARRKLGRSRNARAYTHSCLIDWFDSWSFQSGEEPHRHEINRWDMPSLPELVGYTARYSMREPTDKSYQVQNTETWFYRLHTL